jgi:hypothetical protein
MAILIKELPGIYRHLGRFKYDELISMLSMHSSHVLGDTTRIMTQALNSSYRKRNTKEVHEEKAISFDYDSIRRFIAPSRGRQESGRQQFGY